MYGSLNVAYSLLVRSIALWHCIQTVTLNCELKTMWMEEVMVYFKVIFQHFPRSFEQKYEKLKKKREPVCGPRIKLGTSVVY